MSTTIEQELLQAAERAEARAVERAANSVGRPDLASKYNAEAARLRARAALARELEDQHGEPCPQGACDFERLTGPIPAVETAPTERERDMKLEGNLRSVQLVAEELTWTLWRTALNRLDAFGKVKDAIWARDREVRAATLREAAGIFEDQHWAAHELNRMATAAETAPSERKEP